MTSRLLLGILVVSCLGAGRPGAATITLDSVSRSVSTQVTGGTADSKSSSLAGAFSEQALTADGFDGGRALATQNTVVGGGSTLSLYSLTDLLVSGSRGPGFAPVSVASESRVDMTLTIPADVGDSAFRLSGTYTVLGGADDGSPRVEWSLRSAGAGPLPPTTIFSGTGNSGNSVLIDEMGVLNPGTYELHLSAQVGSTFGPGGFLGSNAQGAAALQGFNMVVSPLSLGVIPEPSASLLLVLGGCMLRLRRRRGA